MSVLLVLGYPFVKLEPGVEPSPLDRPSGDPLMVVNEAIRAAGVMGRLDPTGVEEYEEDEDSEEEFEEVDGEVDEDAEESDGDALDEDGEVGDEIDGEDEDESEFEEDEDPEDSEEDEEFWSAEIGLPGLESLAERVSALSAGPNPAIPADLAEHLLRGIEDGCWIPADFPSVIAAPRSKMDGYESGENPVYPVCSLVRMKAACEALMRALGFDGDPNELPVEEDPLLPIEEWAAGRAGGVPPRDIADLHSALSFHQGARVALEAECELAFG